LVVLAVFYIGGLSTQFDRRAYDGLPMITILRQVGFTILSTTFLLVPLAVMATCIFTYGRFSADGRVRRDARLGIPPFKTLMPALAIGAVAMLGLGVLQNSVIPTPAMRGDACRSTDSSRCRTSS
jgi:lipopolysaccharide export LptBFGC system permease protein LptF